MISRQQFISFCIALLCYSSTTEGFTAPSLSRTTAMTGVATALRYTDVIHPPATETQTFEDKMRKIVTKTNRRKAATSKTGLEKVVTLDEYKSAVADEKEKMVVVRFYAPWCQACKAATPSYMRLSSRFRGAENIKFVDCPSTSTNSKLYQGLGVKTIPFAHVYHPDVGLVEERKIGKKYFSKFEKVLNSYVEGHCEISDDNCTDPYPNEVTNSAKQNEL
mmetsp:Transcript_3557/g.6060  ORF Transcript_3557/g.6060 Transcript_3557/m.6060 type:complete len:220 (-) Transcript_3557:216-875(-)